MTVTSCGGLPKKQWDGWDDGSIAIGGGMLRKRMKLQ
jgi:hypothetical protein